MFASSLSLLLAHLGAYIILPLIPGIIAAWILIGRRHKGWLFYLISWFVGVGVLSYGLFLLQFVRFGIDRLAYAILLIALLVILVVRVALTKTSRKELFGTLCFGKHTIVRKVQTKWHAWSAAILIIYILAFVGVTFFFVTHFPSYADDAFGNRHLPVMNILYDGGVKIFGAAGEILGRARLGYPIMIPTMQAFISNVAGGYNDIYINLFPWLSVTLFLLFIGIYTYQKRRHLLSALVAPALIISLPLIFLHTTQGYMDLLSAIYTSLAIIALYEWLQEDGHANDLILWATFLSIVSYVKNDWFVVYMIGTVLALGIYFLAHRKTALEKLHAFKKPRVWISLAGLVAFFIVPFTVLKSYYHLWFNQAAGADSGLGLTSSIHREIFPAIWHTIWSMNNYSVGPLLFLLIAVVVIVRHKKMSKQVQFLLLAPAVILGIFLLVFLLTENYKFVIDQTTVNRVFTMVLVIFFTAIPALFDLSE